MGRKATGRIARTTSVSLLPEDAKFLEEHNLSATEIVRRWVDKQRDQGESSIILLSIEKLKLELAEKERDYQQALEREDRVRKREEGTNARFQ